ncbi:MAG: hypothetical protein AAGI14_03480 [Pseudomonadota bacterium]
MNAATNQPSILTLRLGQSDQAGQNTPGKDVYLIYQKAGKEDYEAFSPMWYSPKTLDQIALALYEANPKIEFSSPFQEMIETGANSAASATISKKFHKKLNDEALLDWRGFLRAMLYIGGGVVAINIMRHLLG